MSDIRGIASAETRYTTNQDNAYLGAQMTRDGALYTCPWPQRLALAGRVFAAGIGTLSDGEALPAAAITTLRPQLWIRVPANTTIIPLYASVQIEGASAEVEIRMVTMTVDCGNGTSSAADYGPINLRTDAPVTSLCTARQEATGDVTAETGICPLAGMYHDDAAGTSQASSLWVWNPDVKPVCVGASTWALYIGGSGAPTVTAQMVWAEIPSNEVA